MTSPRCFFQITLLLLAITIPSSPLSAQDQSDSWTRIPYTAVEDVVFGHKDGMALTLDVIQPQSKPNGIGIILVSSGSWSSRKSDIFEEEEDRRQNDHWVQGVIGGGFTAFVVRHGSSPRYFVPEMTADIIRSVRFVRHHAKTYGIDPNRIGITSGSSGGHLSLMTALQGDDGHADSKDPIERVSSRTQAVVAWFPPTDLVNWNVDKGYTLIELTRPGFFERVFGKVHDLEKQLREISPIEYVTPQAPPLLLIHGDADKTVPLQQSKIMLKKYEELQRPVQLIVHPGGGHSAWPGIMNDYPAVWDWFLKQMK